MAKIAEVFYFLVLKKMMEMPPIMNNVLMPIFFSGSGLSTKSNAAISNNSTPIATNRALLFDLALIGN
jgi:Kef-type K+ transport system membrane component KefB